MHMRMSTNPLTSVYNTSTPPNEPSIRGNVFDSFILIKGNYRYGNKGMYISYSMHNVAITIRFCYRMILNNFDLKIKILKF